MYHTCKNKQTKKSNGKQKQTSKQTAKGKLIFFPPQARWALISESSSRPHGLPMKYQKKPTSSIKVKESAQSPLKRNRRPRKPSQDCPRLFLPDMCISLRCLKFCLLTKARKKICTDKIIIITTVKSSGGWGGANMSAKPW